MKTLRFALIAALVAVTMAGMANTDGIKAKPKAGKAVNITFSNAVQKPGLVVAMYRQLDPSFLNDPQPLYIVEVTYNKCLYRILGSRQNFLSFFSKKWKYLMDANTVGPPDN